jgi:hypothetical protein
MLLAALPLAAALASSPRLPLRPARAEQSTAEDSSSRGIFGPLRIGPVVGAGVPRPFSVALLARAWKQIGLGVEYSMVPTLVVDDVHVRAHAFAADARWYVFGSPAFIGVAAGVQSLSAEATVLGYAGSGNATKTFVTPRFGILWTFASGFTIGADAGVELPVSSSLAVTPAIAQSAVASNDLVALLTNRPLPEVHLVRLGWMF